MSDQILLGSSLQGVASSPHSSVFDLPTQSRAPALDAGTTPTPLLAADDNGTSFIVISGGTGCNSICSAFGQNACYVLPVSDDGGSSSEIIRVLGGPSIGDIRSRLVRLIPPAPASSPLSAIRNLLAYRIAPGLSDTQAREDWRSIVEGKSPLWRGIPPDRKEAIRGFLVYFESEILRRAHKNFSFRNGSIGNYLLAAAQDFFRSLPSAIFFFSSITNSQANILPVIVTNHTVTIAVELENNNTIVGQCDISHPVHSMPLVATPVPQEENIDAIENRSVSKQLQNASFTKLQEQTEEYNILPARISRLFYINTYGHEIRPTPNAEFLLQLSQKDVLIYSCGSLWTSIMPCLALHGTGTAIARSKSLKAKILLLNSTNDRETHGYTAMDYVQAISRTLRAADVARRTEASSQESSGFPLSAFLTHLVYLKGCMVHVETSEMNKAGVECVEVESGCAERGVPRFDAPSVREALRIILRDKQWEM